MLDSYPHGRELAVMRPTHHFAVPLSYSLPGEVTLQSPEITLDLNQHEFFQPYLLRASPLSLCVRSEYPPPSTSFYSELLLRDIAWRSQWLGLFNSAVKGVAFQYIHTKYHLLASYQAQLSVGTDRSNIQYWRSYSTNNTFIDQLLEQ